MGLTRQRHRHALRPSDFAEELPKDIMNMNRAARLPPCGEAESGGGRPQFGRPTGFKVI